jgi:NAD-dependent DNA ligase
MFDDFLICMSGTLSIKRKEMEDLIKENGGKVSSTVTKKTTHL